jgi:hypothetical protein
VRRGSSFGGVCLGLVSERGEPRESARQGVRSYVQRGWRAAEPEPDRVAAQSAWRNRLQFPRSVLIDWLFAYGGWLFAAGVLCRSSDRESTMVARARAVLATWAWIDDDAGAASLPPLWSTRNSVPPPA